MTQQSLSRGVSTANKSLSFSFLFFVELLDRKNHRTAKSCILSPTPMIHRTLFCYTPRRCRSTEPEGSRVIVSLNKSKEIYIYIIHLKEYQEMEEVPRGPHLHSVVVGTRPAKHPQKRELQTEATVCVIHTREGNIRKEQAKLDLLCASVMTWVICPFFSLSRLYNPASFSSLRCRLEP